MDYFPNLDPYNLVIFYVVVTEKSFTSAAEKLCLTQPAVTYRIKTLEEYTRVKLIDIKTHKVTLTPAGEELYKYAREIYQQLVSADRLVKSLKESNLRVGIASIYNSIVEPVLNSIFEQKNPEIRLTIESGNAFEMVQNVLDARIDLAIVPCFDYSAGKLKNIQISEPMQLLCFVGKEQKLEKSSYDWKELNNFPLVSGPSTSVVRRIIAEKFKSEGIEMRPPAAEVDNIEWCINLVEHGTGLSFAFYSQIENQLTEKALKIVQLKENIYLAAEAVVAPTTFMSPVINDFIAMVKEAFRVIKISA